MKIQGILAALVGAFCIGLALFFTAGLIIAIAVAVPLAIVLAALFGKVKIEVHHDP